MASTSRTTILPQSKEALLKSYNARLKDDVRSMLENFEGKHKIELTIKWRGRTRLVMYHGKVGPCLQRRLVHWRYKRYAHISTLHANTALCPARRVKWQLLDPVYWQIPWNTTLNGLTHKESQPYQNNRSWQRIASANVPSARGYHSSCADLFYWGSRKTYVRLGKNKKPALVTLLHFFQWETSFYQK